MSSVSGMLSNSSSSEKDSEIVPHSEEPQNQHDNKAATDEPKPDPAPKLKIPPNGGTMAWLQCLAGFFLIFNSWGLQTTFGAFLEYYAKTLMPNESSMRLSWIGSLSCFLTTIGTVIFAPFLDLGSVRIVAFCGAIATVFGLMMLSLCKAYWQVMLCQGLIVGLGTSVLFLCGVGSIPTWFTTKRALAVGIAAAGSGLGGVIYPIALRRMISEVGFGWSTRIIGFIVLATCALSVSLIRRLNPPPKRTEPLKPTDLVDLSAFKELPFFMYMISCVPAFMAYFTVIFYAQDYGVIEFGAQDGKLYYTTPIINAGSLVGRLVFNLIADKIGPFNVLAPCLIISMVLSWCFLAIHSLAGFWVFGALYGFFVAPVISLMAPISAKYAPSMAYVGRRIGVVSVLAGCGVLIGGPIAGIISQHRGWVSWKFFGAGLMTGAAALATIVRFMYSGKNILVNA